MWPRKKKNFVSGFRAARTLTLIFISVSSWIYNSFCYLCHQLQRTWRGILLLDGSSACSSNLAYGQEQLDLLGMMSCVPFQLWHFV